MTRSAPTGSESGMNAPALLVIGSILLVRRHFGLHTHPLHRRSDQDLASQFRKAAARSAQRLPAHASPRTTHGVAALAGKCCQNAPSLDESMWPLPEAPYAQIPEPPPAQAHR